MLPKEIVPGKVAPNDADIKAMIKRHEGKRLKPYKDTLGLWTVGYGHLIGNGKSLPAHMNRAFTDAEVDAMFEEDYEHHKEAATKIPGFAQAPREAQAAMIDLTFNMGPVWYKKFNNTMKSFVAGDYIATAEGLRKSLWFKQVGNRGPEIVNLMASAQKSKG